MIVAPMSKPPEVGEQSRLSDSLITELSLAAGRRAEARGMTDVGCEWGNGNLDIDCQTKFWSKTLRLSLERRLVVRY